MFKKILVANRGEIAGRIFRTCRTLGIKTLGIYTPQEMCRSVLEQADEVRCVDGGYLDISGIIELCKQTGVDAVHPGFGFLSENADFAQAVIDNGIVFIGPSPTVITKMGHKGEAKKLAQSIGIPMIPGFLEENATPENYVNAGEKIGYPILLKPSAGGGGKGMYLAHNKADLIEMLPLAQQEGQKLFKSSHVILEKYLPSPRHIEVQIFGDIFGTCVHLFERDCSLQRRHQKIIEEAPASSISDSLRQYLYTAALKLAKSLSYVGAGTVEFLVMNDDFYFLEINTRLQVEHPVTEMITGIDLVAWQIQVAAGKKIPLTQDQIVSSGHAIEARIYAEDGLNDFLPSTGQISHLQLPELLPGVRLDNGINIGDEVTPFYDPMLAKLIVQGDDRKSAARRLKTALDQYHVTGVSTNLPFLRHALQKYWIDSTDPIHVYQLSKDQADILNDLKIASQDPMCHLMLVVGYIVARSQHNEKNLPAPWGTFPEKRLVGLEEEIISYHILNVPVHVRVIYLKGANEIEIHLGTSSYKIGNLKFHKNDYFSFEKDGEIIQGMISGYKTSELGLSVDVTSHGIEASGLFELPFLQSQINTAGNTQVCAPMPGRVTRLYVGVGDTVESGQNLMTIEAMKMEHTLKSTLPNARITAIHVKQDDFVKEHTLLIDLSEDGLA